MKKIISLILCFIMLSSLLAVGIPANAQTAPTLTVGTVSGNAGDTVSLDITVTNNPGILGATLTVAYDDKLTLTGAANGEAFSCLTLTKPGELKNPCNFAWDGQEISGSDIKDGVVLTLKFTIPSGAAAGTEYDVSVSYYPGDIVDGDLNTVLPETVAGKVTVGNTSSGGEEEEEEPIGSEPTLYVSKVYANAGETVNVAVSVKNNPGILGATVTVSYGEGLTLTAAANGEAFSTLTMTKPGQFSSPCNFAWDGQEISDSDIKDGAILTLTFKVDSNAVKGTEYPVTVSYVNGDIVDNSLNAVLPATRQGKVIIGEKSENPDTPSETEEPTFTVASVTAGAGEEATVSVNISNNPGILGATIMLTYDTALTLTYAASGEAFAPLTMTKPGSFNSGCKFTWDGQEITQADIADGCILQLKFTVPENAAEGAEYAISVSYGIGDIVDNSLNPVDVQTVAGKVTVVKTETILKGDIDLDGKVNVTDCNILKQIIIGKFDTTDEQKTAADIDGDTKINATDVNLLKQIIVGKYTG